MREKSHKILSIWTKFLILSHYLPHQNHIPLQKGVLLFQRHTFFEGETQNLQESLDYFETDGLIVLSGNKKIYENYWHENTKDSKHISWSVAKSFLSAMIGIAVNDGLIDIKEPITSYLPEFNGTGYEGVRVKDILQMSSGVRFNEDYGDYNSDINRFGRAISMGTSMNCLLYTSPSPRDATLSRMPSSA